jgi:putative FmdB family regulatory protein
VPLFDFQCPKCQTVVEVLVRPHEPDPACPACGSRRLSKLWSRFAVSSESTRELALTSGRKKVARERRDKEIADQEHESHHHH